MKLSAFELKVGENPWNSLNPEDKDKFQDARNKQVKNWRNVIYKDIEDSSNFSGETDKIPDDHFESGKIDDKPEEKETNNDETHYCNTCGAISSKDGKCYYCDEINKK